MENAALTLLFMMGPGLTQACTLLSVTQTPPVVVAVSGGVVRVSCEVRISGGGGADMSSILYRAGDPDTVISSRTDSAHNTTVTYDVTSAERDTYYCSVTCGASVRRGQGTYIHVRGSGYVLPSSSSSRLFSVLIALSILLLIPAGSGTYLVLPLWKTEVRSPAETLTVPVSSSRPVVEETTGGSLYTSLEPRNEEVYDILEDEPKTTDPAGPKKPKKNISENNVYENFRR